ncbi:MAG: DUF1648 domain-containing protein [Candidatus Aminicenantes bacterium]|nr:DUF1648 domain-containing protein [Candidatus Aminicenantes bacterium]NIM79278.1 DUF1648 domain-containing protein [Candidatus Aminicenantes bacterium]NIN18564.1 DUF1648 domain-containing protein [Candidatus Aminicenantes bacterium]NIN42461.1 DUF1648 domain-containing protein [Candidatus Aminicenantes bacterium]NIN85219.1 DUF1648 domain-containing protein [Candidatus Aminicenantes bacterium]
MTIRSTFLLIFLLKILSNIVFYFILPDNIAIHFSSGGRPDSWAPKEINALIFLGLDLLLFFLFWYAPSLVMNTPEKWISLPNKSFWLKEENKPLVRQKLESLMSELGIATFVFMFLISILTIQANLSKPVKLDESLFVLFLIVFLIYVVFWCIKIFKAFRLPGS